MHRHDAVARELLGTWQGSFSALIESDQPIASHRLMWWDQRGYGTTLEAAASAPSTRWLFAEGATHGFNLFYLLQNQDMTLPADVTIRYLLPSGAPVVKPYVVPPHSRLTIFVNEITELAAKDVSAEVLSTHSDRRGARDVSRYGGSDDGGGSCRRWRARRRRRRGCSRKARPATS